MIKNPRGLTEIRGWLNGERSTNDFRRHATALVQATEAQESELEIAYRLIEAVLRAQVMNAGWTAAAKLLLDERRGYGV